MLNVIEKSKYCLRHLVVVRGVMVENIHIIKVTQSDKVKGTDES